ncbi:MAG: rusticyanin [Thermoplasmataceae archaeon]
MNRHGFLGIAVVLFISVVLMFSALYLWSGFTRGGHENYGFMDQSELSAANITSPGVHVSQENSTVFVNGTVHLTVMAGPMNAPSMYSFEILGLINPEIKITRGSDIHFTIVNIDNDSYHDFVLSTAGPPYPDFPGMGMMSGSSGGYGYVSTMSYLPPEDNGFYAFTNISYNFSTAGIYWYLCTYPGHAQDGMYGKIVVK